MTTKEKILKTALKLFNETSTQAATTNHIAAAMSMSPGNLHYHFANREEIILKLYMQRREEFNNISKNYPSSITDLANFHEEIFKIEWQYRFFYRELLSLLGRDDKLKKIYQKEIIQEKKRTRKIIQNLRDNRILEIPYDNIIDYLCDIIILINQFWGSYMQLIDQFSLKGGIEIGIQRIEETLRPFLSKKALKELAQLER